ncbi:hypothetical protein JKP88DRAFT_150711, partial [Tribonema minus]
VVLELRAVFGWRLSPGYFDVFAQALQWYMRAAQPATPVSSAARGIPTVRDCPISLSKMGDWATQATILGVHVDTVAFTLSLPLDKQRKLTATLFDDFPRTRTVATVRGIRSLIGSLRSLATVARPGRYFVWRLQSACNSANAAAVGGCAPPHTQVRLSAGFHDDLDWWRWLVQHVTLMTTPLSSPVCAHVERPPHLILVSDASRWGI